MPGAIFLLAAKGSVKAARALVYRACDQALSPKARASLTYAPPIKDLDPRACIPAQWRLSCTQEEWEHLMTAIDAELSASNWSASPVDCYYWPV